jgi:hypothetical protein
VAPASRALASSRPKYLAPPGNSAVSQYLEVVPSAAGPAPPRSGAKPSSTLSPAEQRKLAALGVEGRVLANVVAATTPPTANSALGTGLGSLSAAGIVPARVHGRMAPSGGSPVSDVLAAATGHEVGGGLGILLPLMVAGGLTTAMAAALWRRRVGRS